MKIKNRPYRLNLLTPQTVNYFTFFFFFFSEDCFFWKCPTKAISYLLNSLLFIYTGLGKLLTCFAVLVCSLNMASVLNAKNKAVNKSTAAKAQ